jgi:hypothetical protein
MNALPVSSVGAGTDDDALRAIVARAVGRRRPVGPQVAAVARRRFAGATSYGVEILTVELADGGEITMLLKDFRESRLAKDSVSKRRERELRIYEELLEGSGLGAARFYGAARDGSAPRFWLLLEYVEGQLLRDCGYEHWLDAAAWLGRLRGHFRGQRSRLAACEYVVRHDADFFLSTAERAHVAVSSLSGMLARRLAGVLERYHGIRAVLTRTPDTLVHGSYRPQNVLVVRSPTPVRICPIDWELGAFGRSTYDLGYLCDGFRAPRLDELLDAYEDGAASAGVARRAREELRHEVDCFRLHKIVNSLGHVAQWSRPHETALKVLAAGEDLARAVA